MVLCNLGRLARYLCSSTLSDVTQLKIGDLFVCLFVYMCVWMYVCHLYSDPCVFVLVWHTKNSRVGIETTGITTTCVADHNGIHNTMNKSTL